MTPRRALVLVDAEHHPDAVRSALEALRQAGDEPVMALYVGGSEKVDRPGQAPDLGVPTEWPADPLAALPGLLDEHGVDVVIDRTADPVVDDRRRGRLTATALAAGVAYEAPGAGYRPLPRPQLTDRTSVAVIATGKRTGKTALSGAFTRHAAATGRTPCVLAMGRGGPERPLVIPPGSDLGPDDLVEVARRGEHAASDFYEDAVMTGAATVGCRRVGEGPTGEVGHSNVAEGMAELDRLDVDLAILEGSGAGIPPAHADATMLIVPATAHPVDLHAMLPLRFLIADLVVITMADERLLDRDGIAVVEATVEAILTGLGRDADAVPTVRTRFRATPLSPVEGRRVFVATTAPPTTRDLIVADLTGRGAEVVGVTHALSDRPKLQAELDTAPPHDLLLTELKAAAVDVAAAHASANGIETMFYDNRPEATSGTSALDTAFDDLLATADERRGSRLPFRAPT